MNSNVPNNMRRSDYRKDSSFRSILSDLTSTKSILSRMVLAFLLLIIIPVTTIGFIASKTASDNLIASTKASVASATLQTSKYFDTFMAKANDVSFQMLASTSIQKYSTADKDTMDPFEFVTLRQNVLSDVNGINTASTDLDVKLLLNTGITIGNLSQPDDMQKVFQTAWYKKVLAANGLPIWVDYSEGMQDSKTNTAVSLVRLYKNIKNMRNDASDAIGLIIVDVKYQPVSDVLGSINLGKGDSSFLITNDGRVLSSKGKSEEAALAGREFVMEVMNRCVKKDTDSFNTTDNGEEYLVAYHKSTGTELTAVTIVPYKNIIAGADQIKKTTIWTGIVFVLLAGAIGFLFSLGMALAMKKIMGVMYRAEKGDLTVSLYMKRKDEFGRLTASFNDMLSNIKGLVTESKLAAEEVVTSSERMTGISSQASHASNEIARAIVEVAAGSSNQAAEIEISVKNVSQLADRISQAVEKTREIETDSESMKELSDFGLSTIESLNRKTAETNEITADVVKEISQLNQYVKNINVITQVLRSIADQTNLLALNAAIEAARAGEAGKGFSVVAEEIRKLAEQSNNHTREIQNHIENIFKQAQSSTLLVEKAEASIREQSGMVEQTAQAFSRINTTTSELASNISKVGSMIHEMDSNKEMVLSSMENISAVSEQVSASTQEVSASTQEQLASIEQLDDMSKKLNDLAADLIKQMEKFTIQ